MPTARGRGAARGIERSRSGGRRRRRVDVVGFEVYGDDDADEERVVERDMWEKDQ